MYTFRWLFFLVRRSLYVTLRIMSSRLWILAAFIMMLAAYETAGQSLSQGVLVVGLAGWFIAKVAAGNIGPGEPPQRPLGYEKAKKEGPAPVAASMAVAVDSPSVEIARRRLPPHLQAILSKVE